MKDGLKPVNSIIVEEVDIDSLDEITCVSEVDKEVIEADILDNNNKLKGEKIELVKSSIVLLHGSSSDENDKKKENTQRMNETDKESSIVLEILENKETVDEVLEVHRLLYDGTYKCEKMITDEEKENFNRFSKPYLSNSSSNIESDINENEIVTNQDIGKLVSFVKNGQIFWELKHLKNIKRAHLEMNGDQSAIT